MSSAFLLADPALVIPPKSGIPVSRSREFWMRFIEWTADRRMRLGIEGRAMILDHVVQHGWPQFQPPECPAEIAPIASEHLRRLLASGGPLEAGDAEAAHRDIPGLEPAYCGDEESGMALALDLVHHLSRSMIGVATSRDHWDGDPGTVGAVPPPPSELPLVTRPGDRLPVEDALRASRYLSSRRLTIFGGKRTDGCLVELEGRLDVRGVRWIESETSRQPSLDQLVGMRAHSNILCCVTGRLGHAGCEKAASIAKAAGVETIYVKRVGELCDELIRRYGCGQ